MHLIALKIGDLIRANAPMDVRDELDRRYSGSALTFVHIVNITRGLQTPTVEVERAAAAVTDDDVAWQIIAVAAGLHQYRQWRRLITLLILLGLAAASALALLDVLLGQPPVVGEVAVGLLIGSVAAGGIGLGVRRMESWGAGQVR